MRWVLLVLATAHGLIHFVGFAAAFDLAEFPELTQPISAWQGVLFLVAGLAFLVTALLARGKSTSWWVAGLGAVLVSQVLVFSLWNAAKFGTLPNLALLIAVAYGFASRGPPSLTSEYETKIRDRLVSPATPDEISEEDLEHLPEAVRRYLHLAGAVGGPRVHHFKVLWRGRIRNQPRDPWMEFTAEQHNFPHEPSRFFLLYAKKGGLPVDVLHTYLDGAANMRVRLLSAIQLVNTKGPDLDRAETVTVFNDLCLLAPGALVDPSIRWETRDEKTTRAQYTAGANTISAVLSFNEAGELVNFVSDDRLAASADGKELTPMRWSTPVSDYRDFGRWHLFSRGEGRWHPPAGEYAYLQAEVVHVEVNGRSR